MDPRAAQKSSNMWEGIMSQRWQRGDFDDDEPTELFSDSGVCKTQTSYQTIKMNEKQLKTMICRYLADNGIEVDEKTVRCSFSDCMDDPCDWPMSLVVEISSTKTIKDE